MDPPGHTVFLYLQELNRADLQKQAKLYGIKANQKSEVLRRELQRVLEEKDNVKSPTQSVISVAVGIFITAFLASLYPAFKAIRLNPVESMRKI